MSEPIRVLHITGAMFPGGYENFIMNLYENIDRSKIQFDMVVHARKENDYVPKIESMGGHVYELPRLTRKPFSSLYKLYKLVKENKYPIVIRHTSNALVTPQLLVSKLAGAYTICHSHNETDPKLLAHKLGKLLMNCSVDERLACSEKAGVWMFSNKKFQVIHNAIDINKFSYNPDHANLIKAEFGFENSTVYGNVANFIQSKNHLFLLKIYKDISLLDDSARFLCVGDGTLRKDIEDEIHRLGLDDKVILTGIRGDVEKIMSCLDVLVFPSFFEGLPLTLIEAQISGLPCLISDSITSDVIITDGIVEKQSLETASIGWAKKAISMANSNHNRACQTENIVKHGYDLSTLTIWYQDFINQIVGEKKND